MPPPGRRRPAWRPPRPTPSSREAWRVEKVNSAHTSAPVDAIRTGGCPARAGPARSNRPRAPAHGQRASRADRRGPGVGAGVDAHPVGALVHEQQGPGRDTSGQGDRHRRHQPGVPTGGARPASAPTAGTAAPGWPGTAGDRAGTVRRRAEDVEPVGQVARRPVEPSEATPKSVGPAAPPPGVVEVHPA